MKKEELMDGFRGYAETLHEEKISKLENYIIRNYDSIEEEFIKGFEKLCDKITSMQSKKEKREIAYINYSLLRTQIINNKHNYLISAYDDTWYVDKKLCEELYNVSWAFEYLDEYESELNIEIKKYIGKITAEDVKKIKLEKADIYHKYILRLIRKAIPKAVTTTAFENILISTKLDIRVGEYFDFSESVYLNDNTPKDSLATKILFEKKYPYAYGYQNYKSLDLKQGDYEKNNFSHTVFEKCNLSESKLKNTLLRGTRFIYCDLKGAKFTGAVIVEADFSNSELSNSDFCKCNANLSFNMNDLKSPLYERLNFCNSNLENADMSNSNLAGANFINAKLEGCNFRNARLTDALIQKKYQEYQLFSSWQEKDIHWVE